MAEDATPQVDKSHPEEPGARQLSAPWSAPEGAVAVKIERQRRDGTWEACAVYSEHTRAWEERHRLPMTADDLLGIWGSGAYRFQYFDAVGRAKGRTNRALELDDPEQPERPARYQLAKPIERAGVAGSTSQAPATPPGPPSSLPSLPAEIADNAAVRQLLYFQQFANDQAEARIQREREQFDRALQREAQRFEQNMREQEMRHRRTLEHQESLHRTNDPSRRVAQLERSVAELSDRDPVESTTAGEIVKAVKELAPVIAPMVAAAVRGGAPGSSAPG